MEQRLAFPLHKQIWNSASIAKHRFTFWLMSHNRLRTKEIVGRFQDIDNTCILCNCANETRDHLFFMCEWSKQLIELLGNWIRLEMRFFRYTNWTRWIRYGFRDKKRHQVVAAMVAAGIYNIWMERNRRIFTNQAKSPQQIFVLVKKELSYRFNGYFSIDTLNNVFIADRVQAEL
ncbi:hypothetical protein RIF29_40497 [Crotalaria pallida]|uniref:Reverse transcriptase zinc-binding domain-containing protein n=2 Tax=Crotalaria pallida TaxID=3830 RepID=A0AAN9E3M2_CROPI